MVCACRFRCFFNFLAFTPFGEIDKKLNNKEVLDATHYLHEVVIPEFVLDFESEISSFNDCLRQVKSDHEVFQLIAAGYVGDEAQRFLS
jgi:hypothetical protein